MFIDLLDESKDGPWRIQRGRRKSRSERGWDLKNVQEPSTLKVQAGPLGKQLVEGILGSSSRKGELSGANQWMPASHLLMRATILMAFWMNFLVPFPCKDMAMQACLWLGRSRSTSATITVMCI